MANTVTKTSLTDGGHRGVMHIYIASDGSSGELSDEVVLDASALSGATAIKKIYKISSFLVGCSATLEFDATADVPFAVLPEGEAHMDQCLAPITNSEGSGSTGDVTISTAGFTASGDRGVIIIEYGK